MAAPQELYAANSGSSSGRSWAGQLTSENANTGLLLPGKLDKIVPPRLQREPVLFFKRGLHTQTRLRILGF